jgi:hypothetical protein
MTDNFGRITSYPKVYNLGHPAIANLFDGPDVVVEEKIDGSQFSWVLIDGVVYFRSRNSPLYPGAAGMFEKGVQAVLGIQHKLNPGWVYRGEYLSKSKHNSLKYDRVPKNYVILWDIMIQEEAYLARSVKETMAEQIGLEIVPLIHAGPLKMSLSQLDEWLQGESILGGCKIEGVVIKNPARFGVDGKMLAGKYVSEAFKETNRVDFVKSNPKQGDILISLKDYVRNERRWEKSVERLRDAGEIEFDVKDIGKLIKAIQKDTLEECEEVIKERLWDWAKDHIARGCTAGFPEWYKRKLAGQEVTP